MASKISPTRHRGRHGDRTRTSEDTRFQDERVYQFRQPRQSVIPSAGDQMY